MALHPAEHEARQPAQHQPLLTWNSLPLTAAVPHQDSGAVRLLLARLALLLASSRPGISWLQLQQPAAQLLAPAAELRFANRGRHMLQALHVQCLRLRCLTACWQQAG
jgi:hypothetical protein